MTANAAMSSGNNYDELLMTANAAMSSGFDQLLLDTDASVLIMKIFYFIFLFTVFILIF